VPLRALWFGLFGAPAAWAIQLISNYALLSHSCFPRDTPLTLPAIPGVGAVAIMISAALLAAAVAALLVAVRSWRSTRPEIIARERGESVKTPSLGQERMHFMASAGILVSGIFVFGVLMAGVPLLAMPTCVL
jgi:hypothetical protein